MARTWFAGYPTGQTISQSTKDAVPAATDYPPLYNESPSFEEQVAVTLDSVMLEHQHQTATPTQAVRPSESELNELANRQKPYSSSPKMLNSKAINASANSATLSRQQEHAKPNDTQQPVTYSVLPHGMTYQTLAPFSSLPPTPRAPVARMVSQTSYGATNTSFRSSAAAAQTATPTTASPFIPRPNPTMAPNPPTFAPPIAPATSLTQLSSSVLPFDPSSTAYPSINPVRKRKRGPENGLTAAAMVTAPSASSNNTAAATVFQNTKGVPHEKQQADNGGVRKKRQYIRRKPLVKKAGTPGSITQGHKKEGQKRPRVRSPTQSFAQSSRQRQQNALEANEQRLQLMFQNFWPPPDYSSHENPDRSSNGTSSTLSHKRQRIQPPTAQNNDTINGGNGGGAVSHAILSCSEEPRSFPLRLEAQITLRRHSLPHQEKGQTPGEKTIHSKPVRACANHVAHEHHAHGVCGSCNHRAHQLLQAETPQLLAPRWWPLCKRCGQDEMRRAAQTGGKECPCNGWLCFACRIKELEDRETKNGAEAEFRRTYGGKGVDGHANTVAMDWACWCGGRIEKNAAVTMKCVGCKAIRPGKVDMREAAVRESTFRETGSASMC